MQISFVDELKNKKNLLAFSYGSDSTALFYILEQNKIQFDLALINYKLRKNADLEEKSAKLLAQKYNKKIYTKHFQGKFSEQKAKDFRYDFFDFIMKDYDNLIIAHNLNDKFEWFLMQLSKGAGLCNLIDFTSNKEKNNYKIIKPLINITKTEILHFLKNNNIFYFNDESNFDKKYKRNEIRLDFSNEFVKRYSNGLIQSFNFLEEDNKELLGQTTKFKNALVCSTFNGALKAVKKFSYLLSAKQITQIKLELIKNKQIQINTGKQKNICICLWNNHFYIFLKEDVKLTKKEKDKARILKLPPLLRAIYFS